MSDVPEFPVRTFTVEPGTIIVINGEPPDHQAVDDLYQLVEMAVGHPDFLIWYVPGGDVTTLDRDEVLDRLEDWLRER